jgi:hypothetical protein
MTYQVYPYQRRAMVENAFLLLDNAMITLSSK